jgi:hypothetical protein
MWNFPACRLLWEAGERNVPEPLVADRANQIAVYQYVDGAQHRLPSGVRRRYRAIHTLCQTTQVASHTGASRSVAACR